MPKSEIVTLPDGARIEIRPVRPDDKEAIADGFDRLSTRSRYRRFFAPLERLTPADLRYLTEVDHHAHEALIAYDKETGQSLGVARFVINAGETASAGVDEKPVFAELAVTVVDDWQQRGVATALLERLLARAREEGVTHFVALILDENDEAMALFRHLAPEGTQPRRSASGHLELVIRLPEPGTPLGETPLGEALRETAEHRITINPWRVLKRHLHLG
jgi:GNAT superfamily N-acetyltransferase